MSHPVICSICGKKFDRDREQSVKTGARRYAHYKCEPTGELVPLPEKIDDIGAFKLAREIRERIENEMTYPGQIKVSVIREYRAIETAK